MKEKTLQAFFEKYLIRKNIPYEKEYFCHSGLLDFRIELNSKNCGVEVKTMMSSLPTTIGQLILAKKTFSHVYLLAPGEFVQKIEDVILETGVLNDVGIISLREGDFVFIKEPSPKSYYFNPLPKNKAIKLPKKQKTASVGDLDLGILSTFENRIFDYNTIIGEMKISRSNANQRLQRLIKMGLVEEISSDNPKQYRVKRVVDLGTKFPI